MPMLTRALFTGRWRSVSRHTLDLNHRWLFLGFLLNLNVHDAIHFFFPFLLLLLLFLLELFLRCSDLLLKLFVLVISWSCHCHGRAAVLAKFGGDLVLVIFFLGYLVLLDMVHPDCPAKQLDGVQVVHSEDRTAG